MLRDMLRAAVALAAVLALNGCGNGVGNDGAVVGGDCVVSGECHVDSRCLTGASFPGGYCSKSCDSDADCPDGSACVDAAGVGGVCLLSCTAGADCRTSDGYDCVETASRGAGGTTHVCALP